MRWKNKYVVGIATLSMVIAVPLASAAEDDVVVFGGQYEENSEPSSVDNNVEPSNPVVEETQPATENNVEVEQNNNEIVEPENNSNDSNITNEDQNNVPDENSIQIEVPVPKVEVQVPVVNEIEVEVPTENLDNDNDTTPSENDPALENIDVDPMVEVRELPENARPENNETINTYDDDNNYNQNSMQPEINKEVYQQSETEKEMVNERPRTQPKTSNDERRYIPKTKNNGSKELKKQKARFVKLLSDDTYDYYLDRKAVRWINMPYSTSEYMADVWIRMLQKSPNNYDDMPSDLYDYVQETDDEITNAAEKGIIYDEVDVKVLRTKKYFLEHYYIRPKTQQIQFLCELEVIGRPQNAISERAYDYKNWESLIPGSVESSIYYSVLSDIGTGKASKRGHMTFVDMLDEYARIALN